MVERKSQSADKRVEGTSQSADEVGKKNYPLMGFGRRDELPCIRSRCAISTARYPAARSFVMSSTVTEETFNLPPAPDMTGVV